MSLQLRDKIEGQDFADVNQVLQKVLVYENHAKQNKSHDQFKEVSSKEKLAVNCIDDDGSSDEEAGVCVAEWVNTTRGKPLACMFLKPRPSKKDKMKFTFYVTKCDKLFDVLLQNRVIRLSEGHTVLPSGHPIKGKYCKWHGTFLHNTNDCNYFRRQVQSALNDGWLTLGDGNKMRLDANPFPVNVNMINFEEKKVLVRTSQDDTTCVKNVIVSDEPRLRMINPKVPEAGMWKVNQRKSSKIKPTSKMVLEKYTRQRWQSVFRRLGGVKQLRSPSNEGFLGQLERERGDHACQRLGTGTR
jgi:hypothetical protein